jgi:hypothetical protein
MLSIHIVGLLLTIASVSAAAQKHHKVRHKHNLLSLRGNHVNDIREAFDEYRSVIHRAQPPHDQPSSEDYENLENYLALHSQPAKHHTKHVTARPSLSGEHFARSKRLYTSRKPVATTTSAPKSFDNYDEEYDDEDPGNRRTERLGDDANAGSAHPSSDVSSDFRAS